jgi:non-heme chloroperoxidase
MTRSQISERRHAQDDMAAVTAKDGTLISYKDWGTGQAIVFCHGWPLNADMWEGQMTFLASHGFRCIAHDRRGFGGSSYSLAGNNYDTFADDLAALIVDLDLKNIVLVGFSMGTAKSRDTLADMAPIQFLN